MDYKYLCSENQAFGLDYISEIPILDKKIYISDISCANNIDLIKKYNINIIINISDYDNLKFSDIEYIDYVLDDGNFDIIEIAKDAYQIINKNISEKNILIHCSCGISRSPSIVLFYIMKTTKWDFETTLMYLRKYRNACDPNEYFKSQISNFDFS